MLCATEQTTSTACAKLPPRPLSPPPPPRRSRNTLQSPHEQNTDKLHRVLNRIEENTNLIDAEKYGEIVLNKYIVFIRTNLRIEFTTRKPETFFRLVFDKLDRFRISPEYLVDGTDVKLFMDDKTARERFLNLPHSQTEYWVIAKQVVQLIAKAIHEKSLRNSLEENGVSHKHCNALSELKQLGQKIVDEKKNELMKEAVQKRKEQNFRKRARKRANKAVRETSATLIQHAWRRLQTTQRTEMNYYNNLLRNRRAAYIQAAWKRFESHRTHDEDATFEKCCVICLDEFRTHVIVPCGHRCVCEACAQMVTDTCPICRQQVTTVMRVYD